MLSREYVKTMAIFWAVAAIGYFIVLLSTARAEGIQRDVVDKCHVDSCGVSRAEADMIQAQCQEFFQECIDNLSKGKAGYVLSYEDKVAACVRIRPQMTRIRNLQRAAERSEAEINANRKARGLKPITPESGRAE